MTKKPRLQTLALRPASWGRALTLLALASLMVLAVAQPAQAADCPGDIGCLDCRVRWLPLLGGIIFFCDLQDLNGGCACFIQPVEGGENCTLYGECIYTGWGGGGEPPRN